jgi:hypothetical protein
MSLQSSHLDFMKLIYVDECKYKVGTEYPHDIAGEVVLHFVADITGCPRRDNRSPILGTKASFVS